MKYSSPEQAEAAFYQALEKADLAAMLSVWAEDEEILCIHPGGNRLVGIDALRESWRQIFAAGPRMRFQLLEVRVQSGRMLSVHNLYERITLAGQRRSQLVLATNVYVLTPSGWRMLMHHGSPLPADASAPEPTPPGTLH
jgi:ketosteroid isomerase-like protein